MILKLKIRKMKGRSLLVLLAFVPLLTALMGLVTPVMQQRAYAATGSKNDIAERVFSYQAYLMMSSQCIWTNGDGAIRAAEVNGWMAVGSSGGPVGLIAGQSFNSNEPVGSAFQKSVGITGSNLAQSDCDDPLWINTALSLWGFQPAGFLQAIQNAGGFRKDKPNYTTFAVRDHTAEWTAVKKVIQRSAFYKTSPLKPLAPDEKYYDWLTNFTTQCSATFTASPNPNTSEDNISPKTQAYVNGTLTDGYWHYGGNLIDQVSVGTALTANGSSSCGDMAKAVADSKLIAAFIQYVKAGGTAGTSAAVATSPADLSVNCGSTAGVLLNPINWLMCPIIESLTGVVRGLDDGIESMLTINTNTTNAPGTHTDQEAIFSTKNGYYTAWTSMRNYALIFLVLATLIIVISQALGFEILDAYTVRKVLPRLLIAAIALSLSWQLMLFFVQLSNDLGTGIKALIYAPFSSMQNATINLGGGGFVVAELIGAAAFAALGPAGLLSFVATAAITVAVAFMVLILRKIAISLLIVLAPIAIICYVLPNTQKVWKLWWDSFSKALMMFPIIMAFIAVGRVVAATAAANGGSLNSFIAFVAYFAPYLLLPLSFKFAGGLMGSLGGVIQNSSRGASAGFKKYRQGEYQKHGGRRIENAGRRVMMKRLDVNSSLQDRASRANSAGGSAFSRKAYGLLARSTAGYNLEAGASLRRAQVAKEVNDQINTGVDSEVRGLTVNKKTARRRVSSEGKNQFETLGGGWVDEAAVDAGHARWGKDAFAVQSALSYEMRKATTEEQTSNLASNYSALTSSLGMSDNQAGGAWIGAAFENQNQHLQYKHTDWHDGTMSDDGRKKFVSEIYEKKGSYPLAQMGSNTIVKLTEAYDQAEATGDVDTMNHVKAITETFVNEIGMGMGAPIPGATPGELTPTTSPGVSGRRQANTPGAAHVAERVRELAKHTGVLRDSPTGLHVPPPAGAAADPSLNPYGTRPDNNREQH